MKTKTAVAEQYDTDHTVNLFPVIKANKYVTPEPGKPIDVSSHNPIMAAEEATEKFGFNTGALVAIIRLPYEHTAFAGAKLEDVYGDRDFLEEQYRKLFRRRNANTVYVFEAPQSPGRHKSSQQFYLMGGQQIGQLRELERGDRSQKDLNGGIAVLKPGDHLSIGRMGWLPEIGSNTSILDYDADLARRFNSVSKNHLNVEVNNDGHLLLELDQRSFDYNWVVTHIGVGEPIAA